MEHPTKRTLRPKGGILLADPPEKKARFSEEQRSLLESAFRECSTPNSAEKKELAHRLNLRPRQVDDWFVNKRARSKLKKMEEDCEGLKECNGLLKRFLERLRDENWQLKKAIQELKRREQERM